MKKSKKWNNKVKMSNKFLLSLLFGASALTAAAVPAKPGVTIKTQPDGTTVEVTLRGDERSHICLSSDGYLIAERNGFYYYADVDNAGQTVISDFKVSAPASRSTQARAYLNNVDMQRVFHTLDLRDRVRREADPSSSISLAYSMRVAQGAAAPQRGPGLFNESRFPVMGEQKAIVILVQYTDIKFQTPDANGYFSRLLNEPGFNSYGGTGSARDFYIENSKGQFVPQFDLYGPITLSQKRSYYGGNNYYGNDKAAYMMAVEACQQLDGTVDFSQYDRDGDGYIDNVFVFYAGQGEASYGPAESVWPHSWQISAATSTVYKFDGVQLDRYACSNEWEQNRPDGVGTFVHEFSHVMGLPDLYATSYTGAFTPGSWSAMDAGPYNNNGCTPPNYSAFERYALGWMEPADIELDSSPVLPVITDNKAGIIRTSSANEYFLVENRQQQGWDKYIPGHGMLVWHVDYKISVWDQNAVNNTSSHQYVDIEEADGTQTEGSRAGDAFPGTSRVTSFTGYTNPAMKTWAGTIINRPITSIAERQGKIYLNIGAGRTEPIASVTALSPAQANVPPTSDSFTAAWTASADAKAEYLLSVYTKADDGSLIYLPGYEEKNVGTATRISVTGLQPATAYFYTVTVALGLEQSGASNEVEVHTAALSFAANIVSVNDPSDVTSEGFTASWAALEEATDYILTIYTEQMTGHYSAACDFIDGVTNLPAGWNSNSGAAYLNSAYSGTAIPALRLGRAGDWVSSPTVDADITAVSFWHRGSGTGAQDVITVMASVGDRWIESATVPVITAKGGQRDTIASLPAGTRAVKLVFTRKGTAGAVAIDDIDVAYGVCSQPVAVEGYEEVHAGAVTSHEITGLDPDTEYSFTVRASNGTDLTAPSAFKKVRTLSTSTALGTVDTARASIALAGRTLHAAGLPTGATVNIFDITGRLAATAVASHLGVAEITLPAGGIMILNIPSLHLNRKMAVK